MFFMKTRIIRLDPGEERLEPWAMCSSENWDIKGAGADVCVSPLGFGN